MDVLLLHLQVGSWGQLSGGGGRGDYQAVAGWKRMTVAAVEPEHAAFEPAHL